MVRWTFQKLFNFNTRLSVNNLHPFWYIRWQCSFLSSYFRSVFHLDALMHASRFACAPTHSQRRSSHVGGNTLWRSYLDFFCVPSFILNITFASILLGYFQHFYIMSIRHQHILVDRVFDWEFRATRQSFTMFSVNTYDGKWNRYRQSIDIFKCFRDDTHVFRPLSTNYSYIVRTRLWGVY